MESKLMAEPYQMDDFTLQHLDRWLRRYFAKEAAIFKAHGDIARFLEDYPEWVEGPDPRCWRDILEAAQA